MEDKRWNQRLTNYVKALAQFNKAITLTEEKELNDLEEQGLIQSFEFTHELAWNVMKDYMAYQGNSEIGGSRDATREAYKIGIIANGETWMEMIASRNKTSHTYNEETAEEIVEKIINDYSGLFNDFSERMQKLRDGDQQDLFEEK